MAYRDFKDLPRRTASDKALRYELLNIAKYSKCGWYQRGLASITFKSFEKKSSSSGVKSELISNQELAEEFHKPIIGKIEKRKVHSSFKDHIWGSDLVDMQLLSTINKGFPFFYVLLIFILNMCGLFFWNILLILGWKSKNMWR